MSITIFKQTTIMLILIITGVLCAKTKIISKESNKDLSKLLLQVVNPVIIFMSYQTDYRKELVQNLIITFFSSLVVFALLIGVAHFLIPKKDGRETEIERISSVYSNCGFMGIPLVSALFGDEGVFYLAAFITVFNLFAWTHAVILISGEKNLKQVVKVFYSPTVISIFVGLAAFFLQFRLPEIPTAAFNAVKALNTPLAMIIAGVTMSETNIPKLLKEKRLYYVCLLKLIAFPMLIAIPFVLIGDNIEEIVRMTIIVAVSAPSAATCTIFCVNYGKNSVYSSEIFTLSTVLSMATMPLIVTFTEILTNMR